MVGPTESALDQSAAPGRETAPTDRHLDELSRRVRREILERTGGSAGASLGAVELAVAIQAVVPDPGANVFWDHADHALPHAILSQGAAAAGPAGEVAGRALSDAVGAGVVRTLRGDPTPVVAVIDGVGLSTGLAFEAINHAGHLRIPLVLVLIDGQTARGRGVGGIARHLTRIRGHPRYAEAKSTIEQALARMPAGEQAVEVARRLKNSVRELLLPTEMWEELLGFMYLGPVDGHTISALREILGLALGLRRPVVVHVATERGLGLGPGATTISEPSGQDGGAWLRAAVTAARDVVAGDEHAAVVSTTVAGRSALAPIADIAPERFFDVTAGESHAVAFAASLAAGGMRPLVFVDAARMVAALIAIADRCAHSSMPVTLIAHHGGHTEAPAAADLRIAAAIDGLDVRVPAIETDVAELLGAAPDTGRWTLVRLPATRGRAGLTLPPRASDGHRFQGRPTSDRAIVALGPAAGAAFDAARETGATAIGLTSPSLEPLLAQIGSIKRWLLVLDAECGPLLASAWPGRLHDSTTSVAVDSTASHDEQVRRIAAAARSMA